MRIRKVIIPIGGLGTRFLPATKAQPKEMLPIVDTPTIQFVVEEAVQAGIKDILIITGKGKRAIEDHFDRNFELEFDLKQKGKLEQLNQVVRLADLADIHFIRQKELGLPDDKTGKWLPDEEKSNDETVVGFTPVLKSNEEIGVGLTEAGKSKDETGVGLTPVLKSNDEIWVGLTDKSKSNVETGVGQTGKRKPLAGIYWSAKPEVATG